MRYTLAALLAGTALASPMPQGFDWQAIEDLSPLPTVSIPVVDAAAAETTLAMDPTAAAASVSAAVLASPSDTSIEKRGACASNNAQCAVCPTADDTASNFSNNPIFSSAATGASAPAGYQTVYTNKQAASEGVYGYVGFSVLSKYDVSECSSQCDKIQGCQSFNLYFERDPSVDPTKGCSNPPSTTVIKCVYYGGPITPASATHIGQWRGDFQVVIAGSNAYVNNSIATPPDYTTPTFLDRAAINAPLDCNQQDTYLGVKIFVEGAFAIEKCSAACSAQSESNRRHPRSDGTFQTCQFFNTYVLFNDTTSVGQYCSLYSQSWPKTFATNRGQWRGDHFFNIAYSYSASNATGDVDRPVGCSNPAAPKQ